MQVPALNTIRRDGDARRSPTVGVYAIDPQRTSVEFDGASRAPGGDTRVGFGAAAKVGREDWGSTWKVAPEAGGVLVSRKVRIEQAVQAVATLGR